MPCIFFTGASKSLGRSWTFGTVLTNSTDEQREPPSQIVGPLSAPVQLTIRGDVEGLKIEKLGLIHDPFIFIFLIDIF